MSREILAAGGLLLTTLFWSLNAVLARDTINEVPPLALSFWRWALVLVILLPFSSQHIRRDWHVLRDNWRSLMLLGVLSISAYNSLLYIALTTTPAVNVSLLNTLVPVATMLIAWLLVNAQPTGLQISGMLIAILGMLLIIARGDSATIIDLGFAPGDLIMLVGVIIWAIYTVILKKTALPVNLLSSFTAMVALGLPWLLPFYLWEFQATGGFTVTLSTGLIILYMALFASIFAYLLWNNGVLALGPNRSAMYVYTLPIFTAILGLLILHEPIRWFHYGGGLLILAGLYLATVAQSHVAKLRQN